MKRVPLWFREWALDEEAFRVGFLNGKKITKQEFESRLKKAWEWFSGRIPSVGNAVL